MKKFIERFRFTLSIICLSVSIFFLLLLLCGMRPFILKSPSMEPLYPKGSMIWVNTRISSSQVHPGDVLVYRNDNNILVMHRYLGNDRFQGDANTASEHIALTPVNLVGKATRIIMPHFDLLVDILKFMPWFFPLSIVFFLILSCLSPKQIYKSFK